MVLLVRQLADPNPVFGFLIYSAPILSQHEQAANFLVIQIAEPSAY
jgi:hypothetical protein